MPQFNVSPPGPRHSPDGVGVFYLRLVKQAGRAQLHAVHHFTLKQMHVFLIPAGKVKADVTHVLSQATTSDPREQSGDLQDRSLRVQGAGRVDLVEHPPRVHQHLPDVVVVPPEGDRRVTGASGCL